MPATTLGPFAGLMPAVDPKLLNPQHAQVANNCDFATGALAPAKGLSSSVTTLQSGTKTLYWFNRAANSGNGYWLQWSTDVNVVRGQIADDSNLRTYFTGDGAPKMTTSTLATSGGGPYPAASRTLGLPAPNAPTATGPSGEVPEGGQKIATSYVVTYVSDLGEEGPTSEPSAIVDRWDGGTVALTNISVASGSFVVTAKRIYRIELNGVYQFVAEISAATTSYNDTVTSEYLGEAVPSADWVAPNANMIGLTALPNGVLMGWWGNTVAFSEPFQPHAWPLRYRLALDYDVVAAAVSAYGVVVATKGTPYLISGSSPDSMGQQKMELAAACASKRSMVDMGDFVVYASADGLVGAGGQDARVITAGHITPEQWRAKYAPSTIHGVRWGDRYLGFYSGGSFSFSVREGFRDFSQTADCTFLDEQTGDIYLKTGTTLKKWWQGSDLTYTYRSKIFPNPATRPILAARVDADAYPVTLKLYADGNLVKTATVANGMAFRLPLVARYRNFEIELTGTNKISRVQVSHAMNEVA